MGKGAGSQTGTAHIMTTVAEKGSANAKTCPNCQSVAVPRGITSSHMGATGTKHCPYCGHVYGRNSLLDRKVRNIVVRGAGSAVTITVDNATLQMSVAILPDYADNQAVDWSVVAGTAVGTTISASGLVTPGAGVAGNGTVTVVATAKDGSGVKGELVLTLSNQA